MLPYYSHSWMMYRHQQEQQWMMYHRQQHQQQQQTTTNQYQNPWYSSNYQQQQSPQLPLSTPSQTYYQQQEQQQPEHQSWTQFQQYNNYYSTNPTTPYQYGVNNYEQNVSNETTPISSTSTTTSGPLSENSTSTLEGEITNKRPPFKWLESSQIEEKPGRTRTKEKYRMVYTDYQRIELEKEFHCQKRYISVQRKLELAANLGLSERQIKIWFQNRRAKERRQRRQAANENRPTNQESSSSTTTTSSSSTTTTSSSMINQENCYNYLNYSYGNCLNNSTSTNPVGFGTNQQSIIQNLQYLTENSNSYCNLYQNQTDNNVETNKNHSNHNYNIDDVDKSEDEFDDNSNIDFEFVDVQGTS